MKYALAGLLIATGYLLCLSLETPSVYQTEIDTGHKRVPRRPRRHTIDDPRHSYWKHRQAMFWGYETN